jgi:PKD repeat protein
LESYSIVNQNDVQWQWDIKPAPLSITSYETRNPVMVIEPDQTYDITLTVTTPAGSDTKCVKSMIKGTKPVPDDATGVDDNMSEDDLLLLSGNVVMAGERFSFVSRGLEGIVSITLYDSAGRMMTRERGTGRIDISTSGYTTGVYYYIASDQAGYRKTGKLLVKGR